MRTRSRTRPPRDGERIDGMKLGMVDERARTGLPWVGAATRAAVEREAQVREAAEQREEPVQNTAMREFIAESDGRVIADDLAESGDVAQAATVIAFRRRHRLPPDTVLTPALIAQVVARREAEQQRRAVSNADPFDA